MAMRRLISCAAAAVCACAHANDVPDGAPVFLELESAHYVLFTDLREADARETIGRLENVRGALIQGSWHGDLSPSEKLRVIELASSTELHEFVSSAMTAFYQPIDLFGEPMLVMSTDQGPAENVVLKHELAHALHGSFLPRSPRWLFEGLACYLETLRYDAAADRYVVGEPNADRLHFLQLHPETDFRRALSTSTREAVLLGGQEGYAFQSAAWLIVFYLANERGTGLDGYIHRLALGQEAQAAFTAASGGLSLDALAGEVERYQTRMRHDGESATPRLQYRIREVRLPPWNGEVHARRVPAADVEGLRSELFFLSPGIPRDRAHLGKARDAAEAALRLDPTQPLALAVEMALPEGFGAPPPLERIRAAANRRRDDYRLHMLLALAVGPGRPDERRAALARAAELAPQNAIVLSVLASHDVTHGRALQAIPLAQRAAELAPGRAAVLDTLATALARSSRCAEATRVEERAVELAAEHVSAELRKQLLARLDAMRAGCVAVPLDEE